VRSLRVIKGQGGRKEKTIAFGFVFGFLLRFVLFRFVVYSICLLVGCVWLQGVVCFFVCSFACLLNMLYESSRR